MNRADRDETVEDERLDALRNAVVDESTASTGLWLTYLLVLLYLLIATLGVTHRDLFLENSVRLPFLNVDLPLSVYFTLSPILFVVLHAYALINFSLLAGKIGNLHRELERKVSDPAKSGLIRRQLPINIFVQVLAGPCEVRKGILGYMLWLIVGISLVVAPISLLILFQLQFLPYHSELITWWQRIMTSVDLVLLWMLWPSIAHGTSRAPIVEPTRNTSVASAEPTSSVTSQMNLSGWRMWLSWRFAIPKIATAIVVLLLFKIATFPGEFLEDRVSSLKLMWLHKLLVAGEFDPGARTARSLWTNVLIVPSIDVIDHAKFDNENKLANLPVTISLRLRHLEGAILSGAKLRKADFTGAWLTGVQLDAADLREAKFECGDNFRIEANLRECAQLKGALLRGAQLQGASLFNAELQGADLRGANLDGAQLLNANLLGASLSGAHLQGATLDSAHLQGADLSSANLENAWLTSAELQGAKLDEADLQGALLDGADLSGASLDRAKLLAASFLDITEWRSSVLAESGDVRTDVETDPKKRCLKTDNQGNCMLFLADRISTLFDELKREITADVPDGQLRQDALSRINKLDPTIVVPQDDDSASSQDWAVIKERSLKPPEYAKALARQLQVTGCALEGAPYVLQQIISQFDIFVTKGVKLPDLADAFLANDCFGAQQLSENDKLKLRDIRARGAITQ
jgi:uncharacterized protein YjbI with pentapeptide repeats